MDMDDIPVYKQGDNTNYHFSGKIIHRGFHQSKDGTVINADINGAANILRKEYAYAFDEVKDFTYLYKTTFTIRYKNLYRNAKAMTSRSFHKTGFGSGVCHEYRKWNRLEYREVFGSIA